MRVFKGVWFDKMTSTKWVMIESPCGCPMRMYPLSYEPQDRWIRLRAQLRMARLKLTTITPMCLAELQRLGISTEDLKVACIDETP